MTPNWKVIAAAAVFLCGAFSAALAASDFPDAPSTYVYDPSWPKPLPNDWILQGVSGMYADDDGLIWVLNRPRDITAAESGAASDPPEAECCTAPPSVLAFDAEGNLVHAWGIPDSVPGWPAREHTIFVTGDGVVWIGGSQPGDSLLRFTREGEFLGDFGHRGPRGNPDEMQPNNQETNNLLRGVAAAALDEAARELYIADGYLNRRLIVLDLDTGDFKRGWGAYGTPISEIGNDPLPPYDPEAPPARTFRNPVHCVRISDDGLVYVCDRANNRIQVFTKEGEFLHEFFVARNTLRGGSAGSIEFSTDPDQRYLFVADITNNVVWQLNRGDGAIAGKIGHHGRQGGMFHFIHVTAMDSMGNLYTGEVAEGKRVQKFTPAQ